MRLGQLLLAGAIAALVPSSIPSLETRAWADAATGAIHGQVKDAATGEPLAGVTVTVASPALKAVQAAITDETGTYKINALPPGEYVVTFYYLQLVAERRGIIVAASKVASVFQKLATDKAAGEVITIQAAPPRVDVTSTRQGITISRDYVKNIPVRGRTFEAVVRSTGPAAQVQAQAQATRPAPQQPDRGSDTEGYDRIDENPYHRVEVSPLSTFSIDVDTASYANVRRFLRTGSLPQHDAVRLEEMINYFHYDYPAPVHGSPFSISTELGPSPWNAAHKVMRIGLQAPPIADAAVPPRNLVFLIDVSGSMETSDKLPLLVQAMNLVVDHLRSQDKVSIVVYAGASGLVLPATNGDKKETIRAALASLSAGGSTNGGDGIRLAYKLARNSFLEKGINRVILCTDGDFNVGTTSQGELTRLIEQERDFGVFLTVLGFGMGNLKDSTMEKLADRGNGNYAYIDSIDEARKVLVKQAGATLVTVAKDVKIQVEFNPAVVAGYRLIGYENRLLRDQDFNDDTKDAGEIGAGHSVTALYEIVPAGVEVPAPKVDKLKYQRPAERFGRVTSEVATVKVRYKAPDAAMSKLIERIVPDASPAAAQTSNDFRWATAVAGFGMLLRESKHKGSATWDNVLATARGAVGADPEGYRKEMVKLVEDARKLKRP
ncbi:MAG: von Willebrand factor type A domain-containing protein [Deltaproteobacteria bacterium]|nr:von Willebrand factor type A domain-containing protein [Deltaproteobacteria bacterium]